MESGFVGISALHERLREVAGGKTYRALADMTGQNAETVRRYMCGQSPSVEFLTAMCAAHGVSADWLLTGQGPMRAPEARRGAQAEGGAGDVLGAVAGELESLRARLDRVEVYVQTLEARVRGSTAREEQGGAVVGAGRGEDARATDRNNGAGEPDSPEVRGARIARISGAIPQRPRPNAG